MMLQSQYPQVEEHFLCIKTQEEEISMSRKKQKTHGASQKPSKAMLIQNILKGMQVFPLMVNHCILYQIGQEALVVQTSIKQFFKEMAHGGKLLI